MLDDRVKTIKVSSRRSAQVKSQYFTFECVAEVDISDIKENDNREEYIKGLWESVHAQVDAQMAEVNNDLGVK